MKKKKEKAPTGRYEDIGILKFEDDHANAVIKKIIDSLPNEWGKTLIGPHITVRFDYDGYHHTVTLLATDVSWFDPNYTSQ